MARVILDVTTRIVIETDEPAQDWVYWAENFVELSAVVCDDVTTNKVVEEGEIMHVALVDEAA